MAFSNAPGRTDPRPVGFSTGSLALGDFSSAIDALRNTTATAIELSALREHELRTLLEAVPSLDLSQFTHIAFHAPSALQALTAPDLVELLLPVVDRGWPIIVHADLIAADPECWRKLGSALCIENMDKRKPTGRTLRELQPLFNKLPDATFCLDFAHARQIDPSLCEVLWLLSEFCPKLKQIHLSELNSQSQHGMLSYAALSAIGYVQSLIPPRTPVILEFEAKSQELDLHLDLARKALPTGSLQLPRPNWIAAGQ